MRATIDRLRGALEGSPHEWLVLASGAHVAYATGYRSVAGDLFGSHRMVAVVSPERTVLVGGASDAAPAIEAGISPDDYVPFGRFYFEATERGRPEASFSDRHATLEGALGEAIVRAGLSGPVGIDAAAADLVPLLGSSGADPVDANDWLYQLRAVKAREEVDALRTAAGIAETAIDAAIGAAGTGVTEKDLETVVTSSMAAAGAMPRFAVVTAGERSALADARATDRPLRAGDLLRFDVGCTVEGYWSDIGRTAVVGEPDPVQAGKYAAILAGEQAQLDAAAPGITAAGLFDAAVDTVEAEGLRPYRRHHCGHAIGLEVYERPVIGPGWDTTLEPGMVFCVETPYYEIGWGGMMVEDAFVVTGDGIDLLTHSDRSLRIIDP